MKSKGMILLLSTVIIAVAGAIGAYKLFLSKNESRRMILILAITTIAALIVAALRFPLGKIRSSTPATNSTTIVETVSSSADSVVVAEAAGTDEYEVFLSFCGIDTRNCFTDYLYVYLTDAGIRTLREDNELRIGEDIGRQLLKGINESKISIPIFSKNYASSKRCLVELEHMVERFKNGENMIYPIFYHVKQRDVRHQTGSYEKAFKSHEKKFEKERVQSWREALGMVGELKGLELQKETNGHEGKLVKIVVETVLVALHKSYTRVPENLVGIDNPVENVKRLLEVGSKGVRIVGILGMGGIGKTTIAKVTYNQLCESFGSRFFLENVRENSKHRDGILHLQEQLISKIKYEGVSMLSDVDEGKRKIKEALSGRKVLLVLDDVDEISQVNMLMGNHNWFGAHSRIIITTRNANVLSVIERSFHKECLYDRYATYKPELMGERDSLELFSKYAFMRDSPAEGYEHLSMEVVSVASGLPLVLVILGCRFLVLDGKDAWREALRKLTKVPQNEVLVKLRSSYEALQYEQKQIFLDVACFFIGEDATLPNYMWDDCKFYPRDSIKALVRMSLIAVGDDNTFRMHDMLRDLGRQIVHEESLNELGNQSRLWRDEEAIEILETSQGTDGVDALRLSFGRSEGTILASSFANLQNLRYLSMGSCDLDGDFEHLLPNLRWLKWTCSGKFMPKNLLMMNLVTLELSSSRFKEDFGIWSQLKMSKKLKYLDLSKCCGLSIIPHLSTYISLETLKLDNFKSLCRLDGLEHLKSLKYLSASRCRDLETLPSLSNLTNLVELCLDYCEKLVEIQGLEKLESLQVLGIYACRSLKGLSNLSNMKSLSRFSAGGCWKLIKIEGLEKLESLQILDISDCRSLERAKVSAWKECKSFVSNWCVKLTEIEEFEKLESLENLDLGDCKSLERLPDVSNFKMLKTFKLKGCSKLIMIPGLEKLESLEHLDLGDCRSLRRLPDVSNLRRLKTFIFKGCLNPIEIEGVEKLETLEYLDVGECRSLERLLNFSNMKRLKTFKVDGCMQLIEIDSLKKLNFLQNLDISDCGFLKTIIFSNLESLENLTISKCEELSQIRGLDRLRSLDCFSIAHCPSLEIFPNLPNFGMLKKIKVKYCNMLHEVEELEVIESLEYLSITRCDKLREIQDFRNLKNLKTLSINSLKKLSRIHGLEELKSLESLSIIRCKSIEELPDFSNLEKLTEIHISDCLKLHEIFEVEDLASLKQRRNFADLPNTFLQRNPTYSVNNMVVYCEPSKACLTSTIEMKNHVPLTGLGKSLGWVGEHSEPSNSIIQNTWLGNTLIEMKNDVTPKWLGLARHVEGISNAQFNGDGMEWVGKHGETSSSMTEMQKDVPKSWIGLAVKSEDVPNLPVDKADPRHEWFGGGLQSEVAV